MVLYTGKNNFGRGENETYEARSSEVDTKLKSLFSDLKVQEKLERTPLTVS